MYSNYIGISLPSVPGKVNLHTHIQTPREKFFGLKQIGEGYRARKKNLLMTLMDLEKKSTTE